MRRAVQSPQGRIGLGVAALLVVGVVATSLYLFGGGTSPSHRAAATVATVATTKNGSVYTIDPSGSQASFTMSEILFGQPNTVVGKTNQVTGQISVDRQDPSKSQVGKIQVDLSTLATDNLLRNQTLHTRILETDQPANQFATFVTKSISGLPSTVSIGQTVPLQLVGDLTVHQVTRSVTFTAQVTLQSASVLKGQAQATVRYADFNLAIPNVRSVAGVSDNVTLALTFTAHT